MNHISYFPIVSFIIVGISLGVLLISVGKLISPNLPDTEKSSPYECGFQAFEDTRMRFDVRYYLFTILFIIFDLETIFLFPWGVSIRDIGWDGFLAMMVFLLEFILGFIFVWWKGALEWE